MVGMNHLLTLGLVLAATVPAVAHADTEVDPTDTTTTAVSTPTSPAVLAPIPEREPPRWYGGDVLLADGVALGLLVIGGSLQSGGHDTIGSSLMIAGLGTYVLGGPAVHLAHDRPGAALGSLALRAGLPVASAYVGASLERCTPGEWFCGLGGAVLGGLAGMAGAVVLDTAVLAYAPRAEVRVSPMVGGGRLGVSVGGLF